MNSYRENEALSGILDEIFYVVIVLHFKYSITKSSQ